MDSFNDSVGFLYEFAFGKPSLVPVSLLGKGDKKMLSIFWSFAKTGMGVSGVVRKPNCFLEKYLLRNYLEPILEEIALKLARLGQSRK